MIAYQQRVIEEKNDLDEKIARLRDFVETSPVFVNLTLPERQLLMKQLGVMEQYRDILQERIDNFD